MNIQDQAADLPMQTRKQLPEPVPEKTSETILLVSKKLGDGASAKVYKADYPENNCDNSIAVKVFNDSKENKNGAPEKEFQILQQLEAHPNVLKAHDFVKGKGKLQIPRNIKRNEHDVYAEYRNGNETIENVDIMTTELCRMDLFDVISENGPIKTEKLTKYIFTEISNGLNALHTEAKHAHCDVKLENVLIDSDYKLKLCDFGFAQEVHKDILTKYGTESYIAPEIETRKEGETYKGVQADVFSLGVLLFIFTFGAPPFSRASPNDRNFAIFLRKNELFFKVHPSVKKYIAKNGPVSESLIDLLTSMLSSDLEKRPVSVQQVLEHAFFQNGEKFDATECHEEFKQLVQATE